MFSSRVVIRPSSVVGLSSFVLRPSSVVGLSSFANSPVIVIVPVTKATNVKRAYPNNVMIEQGNGGLAVASVALGGQVRAIARSRLLRHRGSLSAALMQEIDRALRITLDL